VSTLSPKSLATPIAVLGAGSWGTALAILLANNGHIVRLWGHNAQDVADMKAAGCNARYLPEIQFPSNLQVWDDLSATLQDVRDILIVVPSHAFSALMQKIKPYLMSQARIVWGTKGVEPESGELFHHVVERILGAQHALAVLSGPSFAIEVAQEKPTAVTVASHDVAFARDLSAQLNNSYFRVYTTQDVVGVEICGAVKNVLAIAAGIVDGLQLGTNALSALITRGLAEMQRLGLALGGKPATFMGLAGLGDLVLTCTGNQSRNRRFGAAIAAGKRKEQAIAEIGQVVEGLDNLNAVYHLAQKLVVEMPIIEQVYRVIHDQVPVAQAIKALFARQTRGEEE